MNKNNSTVRPIHHLGDEARAIEQFNTVASVFNEIWLSQSSGHRLQKLWARRDPLASAELYSFGLALNKLLIRAPLWLKKTVKRIKKTSAESHGLIAEIFALGQISVQSGNLIFPEESQAGYDALAEHSNGWKHYISVKNHDVSDKEKEFQGYGRKIRSIWKNKLRLIGRSGYLSIHSEIPIDDIIVNNVIELIKREGDFPGSWHLSDHPVKVNWGAPSQQFGELSMRHLSDHVVMVAPQPASEQIRFQSGLRKAMSQLVRNTPDHDETCRLVYMRVHEGADLNLLQKLANDLISEPDSGLDCVLFIQPSVVHDRDTSKIVYAARAAAHKKYKKFLEARKSPELSPYKFEIGVGSFTEIPSRIALTDGTREVASTPEHSYVFQQGDYYVKTVVDGDAELGNLSSPGPGILVNVVFTLNGADVIVKANMPESNCLLII